MVVVVAAAVPALLVVVVAPALLLLVVVVVVDDVVVLLLLLLVLPLSVVAYGGSAPELRVFPADDLLLDPDDALPPPCPASDISAIELVIPEVVVLGVLVGRVLVTVDRGRGAPEEDLSPVLALVDLDPAAGP